MGRPGENGESPQADASSRSTRTFGRRDDARGILALVALAGSLVGGGGLGYRGFSGLAEEVHAMRAELEKVSKDVEKGDVKRDEIRSIVDDLRTRVRELELDAARKKRE